MVNWCQAELNVDKSHKNFAEMSVSNWNARQKRRLYERYLNRHLTK